MLYFISFLEGIITFVSPCMLPMLPVYVSYFAGGTKDKSLARVASNSLMFVLGFTTVFLIMGIFAGVVGSFVREYQMVLNLITGAIVVVFGLEFAGVFSLGIFNGMTGRFSTDGMGLVKSYVFGLVFSIGWTPCVGAFLGSALMMASQQGSALKGMVMLLFFSLGLGIPFVICAVLIGKLKSAFDFIKRHYRTINTCCGIFLIIIGILMMTGFFGKYLSILG